MSSPTFNNATLTNTSTFTGSVNINNNTTLKGPIVISGQVTYL